MSEAALSPVARIEQYAQAIDVKRIIALAQRHLRLGLAVAAGVFVLVALYTFLVSPRYTASATVMVDTHAKPIAGIESAVAGLPVDSGAIDTEVEILKSRSLAERVVKELNLEADPEFNAQLRGGGLFGHKPAPDDRTAAIKAHEAVVDAVLSGLSVRRSAQTYVIEISYRARTPAKAATIANGFADKYLLDQLETKYDATQQAMQWLNQRLAELQPQVERAEAAVQDYKARHGLLASVGSTLTEQEISNIDTQLDQAKADLAEKDARLATYREQAGSGSSAETLAGALNNETVTRLRAQQAEASAKVADLQTKYGPRHPEVQRAQRQLDDVNSQIAAELSRQGSSIENEDKIARERVASLEGSLSGAKGALVGNNAASVELDDLQRRANAAATLYDSLLGRAKQISTEQGAEQSDARIVSRAKIPTSPSFPNRTLNLAAGLILGLAAGAGSMFVAQALDSGLTTSEDIERWLSVPHLGSILLLEGPSGGKANSVEAGAHVVEKPLSAFSESLRSLRASILFSRVDAPVKVVALTSALPGEGKTTTTFCLGKSMALSGSRVVIVDCDLRRGGIDGLIGAETGPGLTEVLQGQASLDEALRLDEASGASFLPLSRTAYTPKDLFGSKAMDRLLTDLRERFDVVLLDTAPVLPVSETRILAAKADVVVFLAHWRKTPRKAIEGAFTLLERSGADIAGVALTMVDAREQARYGYGDTGYYYKSYSRYYTE